MVVCSVLIGVLIIVIAVSAVMIVSGIIQPISQLNQATEKIAQGDFNARAQVDSEDEVAELAVSFNKMAGSMQSLIDKVKEDERKCEKQICAFFKSRFSLIFFIIRWTLLCG